ncbi:MAG: hypothetical protein DLM60_24350 [Pseudonocardiales bacterium]|nr:MAG: hypothetical protein DLM60_24350 [Pseudonocardiales bacterium]
MCRDLRRGHYEPGPGSRTEASATDYDHRKRLRTLIEPVPRNLVYVDLLVEVHAGLPPISSARSDGA